LLTSALGNLHRSALVIRKGPQWAVWRHVLRLRL
jgi:hypothetical protein